jgi:hypothetical protein
MKKYKESIIKIFKNYEVDPENEKPGIRWAFKPIKAETKFLILGINPSNSLILVNSVIKKSADRWFTGKFKTQLEYDLFLANKENEEQIILLQELAHEHHPHFYKHKKFLNPSLETLTENNQSFQFFDLFPVWRKKQEDFLNEIKDDQKRDSINAFIDLVDRHPNIDSLLFLNGGAGDFFMKENKKKWDTIDSVDVGKSKKVKEANFKLSKSNREIHIYCFAIGEDRISDFTINELGKIFNSKLPNM